MPENNKTPKTSKTHFSKGLKIWRDFKSAVKLNKHSRLYSIGYFYFMNFHLTVRDVSSMMAGRLFYYHLNNEGIFCFHGICHPWNITACHSM